MTEIISFDRLPGGSRLFLDYLYDPQHVGAFFAWPFRSAREFQSCARLLADQPFDRAALIAILARQNREFETDGAAFRNIDRLSRNDTLTIFTGQQVGLFGGPLYTIYKALGAIGWAKKLEEILERPIVPVFWLAADDHDFAEVRWLAYPGLDNRPHRSFYEPEFEPDRVPTSLIRYDFGIDRIHEQWRAERLATEFSPAVDSALTESFHAGATLATAFGRWMARVFAGTGLVLFSPSDPAAKRPAVPLFERELRCPERSARALELVNLHLAESGYHLQVSHQRSHTHLFHFNGRRVPLDRTPDGQLTDGQQTRPPEWWIEKLHEQPENFSPDVLLRPVLQNYLFPNVAYVGGPSEVAYWAQSRALFELNEVVQPVVVNRPFVTLVESKVRRAMEKLRVAVADVLADPEAVVNAVTQRTFPVDLQEAFAETRKCFAERMEGLERSVAAFEPTLEKTFGLAAGKINTELTALEKKAFQAHKKKNEIIREQVYKISAHLLPEGKLQERVYGLPYYLNKYGFELISHLQEHIRHDLGDHQFIDL